MFSLDSYFWLGPNLIRRFRCARLGYLFLLLILTASIANSQSNTGDLRLKVTDPSGAAVRASITIASGANDFRETYATDESGAATIKRLPYGIYNVDIRRDGFAPYSAPVEIRTATPTDFTAKLSIASPSSSVEVKDSETLIDPYRTGSINRIGSEQIEDRESSLPGRSLQDLVNSQPGWIYEGNAVLHPRGSEYQTQIIVDGIPLQDNRSPSFGPDIEADDLQSISIFTADFPANTVAKWAASSRSTPPATSATASTEKSFSPAAVTIPPAASLRVNISGTKTSSASPPAAT